MKSLRTTAAAGLTLSGLFVVCCICSCVCSCGVRGRPQPPLTPAEIGHGQPSFKRSTGEDSFQNIPSPDADVKALPTPNTGRVWSPPSESN